MFYLLIITLALVSLSAGLAVALVMWYLAVLIGNEFKEFVTVYKGERLKCTREMNDFLYTEWVEEFRSRAYNPLREYADV